MRAAIGFARTLCVEKKPVRRRKDHTGDRVISRTRHDLFVLPLCRPGRGGSGLLVRVFCFIAQFSQ